MTVPAFMQVSSATIDHFIHSVPAPPLVALSLRSFFPPFPIAISLLQAFPCIKFFKSMSCFPPFQNPVVLLGVDVGRCWHGRRDFNCGGSCHGRLWQARAILKDHSRSPSRIGCMSDGIGIHDRSCGLVVGWNHISGGYHAIVRHCELCGLMNYTLYMKGCSIGLFIREFHRCSKVRYLMILGFVLQGWHSLLRLCWLLLLLMLREVDLIRGITDNINK